jgi:hypothetical protein
MAQESLLRSVPENVAKPTDTPAETSLVNPVNSVDPYRANRELERWLFRGVNRESMPRPDQGGTSDTYEGLPTTPQLSADWKDRTTHVGTIVYDIERDKAGKIINISQRFEPIKAAQEDQTQESNHGK